MAYIGNSPANCGNYQIVDDIASSFNGTTTSFALTAGGAAITPAKSGQLLVGINGVMQEPDDTGTNGFKVSASNIVFSSAPATGDTFWAVFQGQNVDIGTPSNDTVDTAHLKDGSVTAVKIDSAVELGGPSLGTSSVIRTNANAINEDITIPAATNGMTAGPVTVGTSYAVTLTDSSSTWSII